MPDIGEDQVAVPRLTNESAENAGAVTSSATSGTLLTAGSPAHTKASSWTQLIASMAKKATMIIVTFPKFSSQNLYLVDIGIGASGSEAVLVPNLFAAAGASTGNGQYGYVCPVMVPAGSRISARAQASVASSQLEVLVILVEDPEFGRLFPQGRTFPVISAGNVENAGAVTSTSAGTVLTAGNANAKGNWAPLITSTANRTTFILVMLGKGSQINTEYLVDIGMGASGSESVLVPNIPYCNSSAVDGRAVAFLAILIPAGTRISARCQCATGATTITIAVLLFEEE